MTQVHTTQPYLAPQHPQIRQIQGQPAAVFGTVFFEVVLTGTSSTPVLPGWNLRLWPQARLGDATLEASPDGTRTQNLSTLIDGLAAQGMNILGPVKQHR